MPPVAAAVDIRPACIVVVRPVQLCVSDIFRHFCGAPRPGLGGGFAVGTWPACFFPARSTLRPRDLGGECTRGIG